MDKGLTNRWWGLERRFPRFATLPPATPFEGIAIGASQGLLLVAIGYMVQAIWFDQIQSRFTFSSDEYLIFFGCLFGVPLLFGLGLFLALRITRPKPDLSDEVRFRAGHVLLAMFREKQRLGAFDWIFIVGLPLLAIIEVQFMGVSVASHWREWPIGIATLLTAILLRTFRKNPFIPVSHAIEIPAWVDDLIPSDTGDTSIPDSVRGRRAFCRHHGIVDRDDCTTRDRFFTYMLDETLPEEIREVGVQCGADTLGEMAKFLSEQGGAYYQKNGFQGALQMIDCIGGCLPGNGAVEMKRLAAQILTRARFAGWSRFRLAEVVLHFVQRAIEYADDQHATGHSEYGRFPLQTLVDGKGDCECTAMLCCAILSHLGYDSALVFGDSASGTGHVVSAIRPPPDLPGFYLIAAEAGGSKADWLYGETTLDAATMSWQNHPSGFLERIDRIVQVPRQAS